LLYLSEAVPNITLVSIVFILDICSNSQAIPTNSLPFIQIINIPYIILQYNVYHFYPSIH